MNIDNSVQTKKALIPIFGFKHVRVTRGRGTASSWIHIHVQVPRPIDCHCSTTPNRRGVCEACDETRKLAHSLIDKATETISYGTFYSDDGYSTAYPTVNVDVRFDNEYSYDFGTKDPETSKGNHNAQPKAI